jgi:hypothetical protein
MLRRNVGLGSLGRAIRILSDAELTLTYVMLQTFIRPTQSSIAFETRRPFTVTRRTAEDDAAATKKPNNIVF